MENLPYPIVRTFLLTPFSFPRRFDPKVLKKASVVNVAEVRPDLYSFRRV